MRLRTSALALLALLFTPLHAVPAGAVTESTPSAIQHVQKAKKTKIVLRVKGCNGCMIQPTWAPKYTEGHYKFWTGVERKVRKGKVVFTPRTARTRGLYFVVTDPGGVSTGAQTLAVTQYRGSKPGRKVTARKARTSKAARHCWAGTTRAKMKLNLTVNRYAARDVVTQERGYAIRPYLSPATRGWGAFHPTYKGTIGAQDIFFCTTD